MYPALISRPTFIFASVTSVLLYLGLHLAFPQLVALGNMGLAMIGYFFLRPLSLVLLCGALLVFCAQRARTLGLAWAWGLAIPVLVGMDWMIALHGPLMLLEPSAFPIPLRFPWAAGSAALLIAIFSLLPTGAFLSNLPGARLVGYSLLFFIILSLVAGYIGSRSPYVSAAPGLSAIAIGGMALAGIALWVLTLREPRTT